MPSILKKHSNKDGYIEFTKLCLIYLNFPNITETVKLNQSRALHKARYMAKLVKYNENLSSWAENTATNN